MTAPLVGLNELRIGSAHIGRTEFEKSFKLLTSSVAPTTTRDRWLVCVDAVADSLNGIAGHLGIITTGIANQKPTLGWWWGRTLVSPVAMCPDIERLRDKFAAVVDL
jgi:hypothetical protein